MAAPLVIEVVRATGLPLRDGDGEKKRSPYLKLHLEPASALAAAAPTPAPQRAASTECWDEDAPAPPPAAAPEPAPAGGGAAGRAPRPRRRSAASAASATKLAARASSKLDEARKNYEEHQQPPPPPGSTPEKACRVAVGDLAADARPFPVDLAHAKHRSGGLPCALWLRRAPLPAALGRRSVGCLVLRHGESCWNEAQAGGDYAAMVMNRDHALTPAGVRQAARLNATWKRAWAASLGGVAFRDAELSVAADEMPPVPLGPVRSGVGAREPEDDGRARSDASLGLDADDDEALGLLLRADGVWSSPLTRAVQTALVGLHGHPALDVLELHATAREIKGMGGLDCVGLEVGAANIGERVERKLAAALVAGADDEAGVTSPVAKEAAVLGAASHAAAAVCAPKLVSRDCDAQWWVGGSDYETGPEVALRYGEFCRELQYESLCGGRRKPVIVGHSMFIRGLFERFLSDNVREKQPAAAAALATRKLRNCGLAYVEFVFDDAHDAPPVIADVRLLFGSRLEAPKKDAEPRRKDNDESKRTVADAKAKAAKLAEQTKAKTKLFASKARASALKLKASLGKKAGDSSPPPRSPVDAEPAAAGRRRRPRRRRRRRAELSRTAVGAPAAAGRRRLILLAFHFNDV
ncbi:phosphoglycerate mutase [Aureococcus anophagefferens]|nr:phosphoglycerate mutase [Aureococcus anophagefferens]